MLPPTAALISGFHATIIKAKSFHGIIGIFLANIANNSVNISLKRERSGAGARQSHFYLKDPEFDFCSKLFLDIIM